MDPYQFFVSIRPRTALNWHIKSDQSLLFCIYLYFFQPPAATSIIHKFTPPKVNFWALFHSAFVEHEIERAHNKQNPYKRVYIHNAQVVCVCTEPATINMRNKAAASPQRRRRGDLGAFLHWRTRKTRNATCMLSTYSLRGDPVCVFAYSSQCGANVQHDSWKRERKRVG